MNDLRPNQQLKDISVELGKQVTSIVIPPSARVEIAPATRRDVEWAKGVIENTAYAPLEEREIRNIRVELSRDKLSVGVDRAKLPNQIFERVAEKLVYDEPLPKLDHYDVDRGAKYFKGG